MIDIHCHILPGLDDGPRDMETSIAMAKAAAQDGITTVIATPHTDGVRVDRETVTAAVNELNIELKRLGLSLDIAPGFEIPSRLALDLAAEHTLAGSKYVLVEFPHQYLPADAADLIATLADRGLRPIIAHPERNRGLLKRPELLDELISAGALAQLTAASLTGELGPDGQRCAVYMLTNSAVHFIATDSHSPSFRSPILSRARAMATKLLGLAKTELLLEVNPAKILGTAAPSAR